MSKSEGEGERWRKTEHKKKKPKTKPFYTMKYCKAKNKRKTKIPSIMLGKVPPNYTVSGG